MLQLELWKRILIWLGIAFLVLNLLPLLFYALGQTLGNPLVRFVIVLGILTALSVPLGGHNPAEPATYDAALLTGPSHGDMFAPFLAAGAAETVADGEAMGAAVLRLLGDDAARRRMAAVAAATLARERGAVARTMAALGPLLDAARAAR